MADPESALLARRLSNQQLIAPRLRTAAEVVGWLGAVQAQEYTPAKWGVGQRAIGLSDADVEQAFIDGAILRTHVLRPTWHFVTPRDIRWMLALTGPHVAARMAPYNRHYELDAAIFVRSHDAIARALEGGTTLTRAELAAVLAGAGIPATTQRLAHLMMRAELDQVICSGPRRGKYFTYALLADRAPATPPLARDEALAELARRYAASHGPATTRDFAWWSGLPMRDAKRGLEAVSPTLRQRQIESTTYWSVAGAARPPRLSPAAHLLPVYDEYLIAYKDRDVAFDPRTRAFDRSQRDDYGNYLVIGGQFAGAWRWVLGERKIVLHLTPYRRLTQADTRLLREAANRLSVFASRPVTMAPSGA